jgi:multidrug efflux pump subunit AcrA (membrane-fusion protein)
VAGEFTVYSQLDGVVYNLLKEKGELVNQQTPLATLGQANEFLLEMQVDEFDIFKVREGLPVVVTMDSYPGRTFEAKISRVVPIMNERNKAFLVEAVFITMPEKLFPNVTFEANIVLQTKKDALLVPRRFFVNDTTLVNKDGKNVVVKIGLKDFQFAEVLSGISENEEIMLPKP